MQNKRKMPLTNIGSVSLIMIFIILCMVIFAVLSLSESTGDYNFTRKLADHTTAYYTASNQAEEVLSDIDDIILSCVEETTGAYIQTDALTDTLTDTPTAPQTYAEAARSLLISQLTAYAANHTDINLTLDSKDQSDQDDLKKPENPEKADISPALTISFRVTITDTQALSVKLLIDPSQPDAAPRYIITAWQTIQTGTWTPDNTLNLIQ